MRLALAILAGGFLAVSAPAQEAVWEHLRQTYDKDGNGRILPGEYPRGKERFERLDRNRDGVLDASDFAAQPRGGRPRDEAGARAARPRAEAPKAGSLAPDFELPTKADPKVVAKLSSHRGQRPVALIFGSYT
jgi:hypothetical protein